MVLGMVEFETIAAGIRASDAMVKAAPVTFITSRPITPGRYMSLVTGDVASVEASVRAGVADAGQDAVLQSFVLADLDEQIAPALRGEAPVPERGAVGVLETSCAAAIVEAADAACKASAVRLLRLHLALHVGGKGFAVFVGEVADVEAALAAGVRAAGGALLDQSLLPNPYPEVYEQLSGEYAW